MLLRSTKQTPNDCWKNWSQSEGVLTTDVEVFPEILRRYAAINRRDAIQSAFDALLVDEVLPIDQTVVDRAKQIVLAYRQLSARDGIHLAIMQQHGIAQILSFDSGFDGFPGITRLR